MRIARIVSLGISQPRAGVEGWPLALQEQLWRLWQGNCSLFSLIICLGLRFVANRESGVIPACCSSLPLNLGGFPEGSAVHSLQNSQWDWQGLTLRDCFSSREWLLHFSSTGVDSAFKRICVCSQATLQTQHWDRQKKGGVLAGKGLDSLGSLSQQLPQQRRGLMESRNSPGDS